MLGRKLVTIHIRDKKKQANEGYTELGTYDEVSEDGNWKYKSGMIRVGS